jgi:serine/threonine protein kinase
MKGLRMNPVEIRDIIYQILMGLAEMHACHLVHRNVRPKTILLKKSLVNNQPVVKVKLTDYRISCQVYPGDQEEFFATLGTPGYVDPSLIALKYGLTNSNTGQIQSVENKLKTDIFAVGAILYQMIF